MKKNIGFSVIFGLSMTAFNVSHAADALPKFECTLSEQKATDDKPAVNKTEFNKETAEIYLTCSSEQVKKGQSVKAVWIADDTNGLAPANYKIDEKSYDVPSDLEFGQIFTANMSLSKPDNGWPVGSYHVDFYLGDKLISAYKFTVAG